MTKQEFLDGVKKLADAGPMPDEEIKAIGEFDPRLASMLEDVRAAYNKAHAHCKAKLEK